MRTARAREHKGGWSHEGSGGPAYTPAVTSARLERRLFEVGRRLRALRDELGVLDEQVAVVSEAAADAQVRALVSETPLAEQEHREAARHAEAMARSRADVVSKVAELEKAQDELLDQLLAESR